MKKAAMKIYDSLKDENLEKVDIQKAENKAHNLGIYKEKFLLMIDLVKDVMAGNYKISGTSVAILVGAILYVISPVDAIPDIAPVLGWLDDIGIISIAINQLGHVLDDYKLFLMEKQPIN